MIKAVIFDMYETLVTHYACPLYFGTQMAQDAGLAPEKFRELWVQTEPDRTIGRISLEEIMERILKANDVYSEEVKQKICAKRRETKRECFKHLDPQILPMLEQLKKNGIRIGLISNCYSEEDEVIRQSILFPYFDAVCLSYSEGVRKPDPEIFQRCLERLDVNEVECLYIGDGGSHELEAASLLGMQVYQCMWYLRKTGYPQMIVNHGFEQLEHPREVVERCVNKECL